MVAAQFEFKDQQGRRRVGWLGGGIRRADDGEGREKREMVETWGIEEGDDYRGRVRLWGGLPGLERSSFIPNLFTLNFQPNPFHSPPSNTFLLPHSFQSDPFLSSPFLSAPSF
ncbi:hypothetical protein Pcinc_033036 [Petrolisthes cinctipes]|uniref:Uncharacterized protein n=1 Tax=Petrolisthes cinctipes TaxID=88211 RepID=A0AAE1ET56_PETCI|nr:hypothetical protein Pcinc_033036 [Petrolisthes cinctipes]